MPTQTTLPLATDDLGTGGPGPLCILGCCGDRSVFEPIRQGLAQHPRTITADLPDEAPGEIDTTVEEFLCRLP